MVLSCEAVARAALGEPLKREGAELIWRCTNTERHRNGDTHPSLKVNPRKNVWACFPCAENGTAWQLAARLARLGPSDRAGVTAWLKERGLLDGKKSAKAANAHGPCVAEYVYRDAAGNPEARKLRFEPGANGRKKDFGWQRWQNGTWADGLAGLQTPLYRLPEITHERVVVLTEGEKDADAGARIGMPTTTSGGTGTFRLDHAEGLRGKDVVIVTDADDPGREYAQKVAAMLYGKAATVRVCEIRGSKDLAKAIEKGAPLKFLYALFEDTTEWKPAQGCEILDSVFQFIRSFVSITDSQARAVTLWTVHTHAMEAADCTPYLSVNSAEKGSGKTRLLEVLETLVHEPWLTGRATAAVLVRKIDAVKPTLLLDESDTAFGGEKDYAEALRGILNSGYRRSGTASSCIGKGENMSYKDFETFCTKAIAGIGTLPDTVADRSIPIRLKRVPRGEVRKFRKREVKYEAAEIKMRLAAWCAANLETLRDARPEMPESLSDRQADCCEPLFAIAELAGSEWPEAARLALVELCAEAQADDKSVRVRLLTDIRQIFTDRAETRISSADLVEALAAIETSPWGEWSKGKPLSAPKLARLLGPLEIAPDSVRFGDSTRKGYLLSDFEDAFSRYLVHDKRNNGTAPQNTGGNQRPQNETVQACSDSENMQDSSGSAARSGVPVSKPGQNAGN